MATATQERIQTRTTRSIFESAGARTKRATFASSKPVLVMAGGRIQREILTISGATGPESAPLLVDHERSVQTTCGTVTAFQKSGGEIQAELRFASGTNVADETWQLVSQGHIRSVSVGYRVTDFETVPPGRSKTVKGKTYTAGRESLRVVTAWEIIEVSILPIPADSSCLIRSAPNPEEAMSRIQFPEKDQSQLRLRDLAEAYLRGRGETVDEDPGAMIRSWAAAGGVGDLGGQLGDWLTEGYQAAADSTAGWLRTMSLPNYLTHRLASISDPVSPSRVPRGRTAPLVATSTSYESWSLFKLGCTWQIDEQELLDSGDTLDVQAEMMRQVGAGFRRSVLDAVWGLILQNPTLADGTALFHADRANLGSTTLGSASLGAAWAAIAGQVRQSDIDENAYAHENLLPKYLIVPPAEVSTGMELLQTMSGDSGWLSVRSESRLGASGFRDPRDETIRSGHDANWMLACDASQAPSIVLGFLNGQQSPRFDAYELRQGKWGIGFSADLSIGVTAVDGRPLFFSEGS